eukprot:jgi/Mesvir1/25174/Mv25361-RA.1
MHRQYFCPFRGYQAYRQNGKRQNQKYPNADNLIIQPASSSVTRLSCQAMCTIRMQTSTHCPTKQHTNQLVSAG